MATPPSLDHPANEFWLLPGRAAFWPARSTLLVADLHLGKAEALRRDGVPVPTAVGRESLDRLSALIELCRPDRVLVLGDLLHAPAGLTPTLIDSVVRWRRRFTGRFELIRGNHDRQIDRVADLWHLKVHPEECVAELDFIFSHAPTPSPHAFNWAGHLHPLLTIRAGADRLRLPCFHISRPVLSPAQSELEPAVGVCVLPAFSLFTAGVGIRPAPTDAVFAITDDRVMKIDHLSRS